MVPRGCGWLASPLLIPLEALPRPMAGHRISRVRTRTVEAVRTAAVAFLLLGPATDVPVLQVTLSRLALALCRDSCGQGTDGCTWRDVCEPRASGGDSTRAVRRGRTDPMVPHDTAASGGSL